MKLLKKLMMVFGALFLLLVAAAAIVPLVVDVDKYRPEVETAVNDRINGKFTLGKLKLSLWGQIRIQVGGLKLADGRGHEVVSVNDAYFHLPFTSILSGSPSLIFKMDKPVVRVSRDAAGKLNVMALMKSSGEAAPSQSGTPSQAPVAGGASKSVTLPAIVSQSRLTLEMTRALVSYKDAATGLDTQVSDFNFAMRDISLSRPIQIEAWADLDTRMGKSLAVKGPFRLKATAQASVVEGKVGQFALTARASLDDLDIQSGELFHKRPGMAANADLVMNANDREARIEKLNVRFFNAEVQSQGVITNLATSPAVQYSFKSNSIEFKPWVELVPMLAEYELGGAASIQGEAKGPADKLGYNAFIKVEALTAKAPKLKTRPQFDGTVKIATDQIEDLVLTMKAPGNDLKVQGKMVSFSAPKLALDVTSNELDLDQLVEFPPMGTKKSTATGGAAVPADKKAAPASESQASAESDYDALLEPMRDMKLMKAFVASMNVNMKMIKAYNVRMTDIVGKAAMKDLAASIDSLAMKIWSGTAKATFYTDMKPKAPTYRFSTNVAGLELQQAVESQFHLFKNTLLGKASFDMTGEGKSFNPTPAMQNLKAKGKLRVDRATFATIDVARMTTEALNGALAKVGDQVPALKGKSIGGMGSGSSKYDYVSSTFVIDNGRFTAPDFVAKAAPNMGIDLKGALTVGMIDYKLDTTWDVIDTYNQTKARDLSADINGVRVDHILAEGSNPVRFTVHAGGTAFSPTYSYTEVPGQLAKVAASNVGRALGARAQEEIRKKAEQLIPKEIQKAVPQQAPQQIQDLGKKLFGG